MIGRTIGVVLLLGLTKCVWSGASLMGAAADATKGPRAQTAALVAAVEHYQSEPRMARYINTGTDACLREWADGERVPDGLRAYYRGSVKFVLKNGKAVLRDPKGMMGRAQSFDSKGLQRANRTLSRLPDYKRKHLVALHGQIGREIGTFLNCVTEEASRKV